MKLQSELNRNNLVDDNRCFQHSLDGGSFHLSHPGYMCTVDGRGCMCIERTVSLNPKMIRSSTNPGITFPYPHSSVRRTQNKCSPSHLPGFLRLGIDCPVQWHQNNSYGNQDTILAQSLCPCWDLMAKSLGDSPRQSVRARAHFLDSCCHLCFLQEVLGEGFSAKD